MCSDAITIRYALVKISYNKVNKQVERKIRKIRDQQGMANITQLQNWY